MTPSKPFASGPACSALTSGNATPARVRAGRRIQARPNSEFTAAAQDPETASRCPILPCPTCQRHYGECRSWAARSFIRDRRGRSAVTQRATPSPSWRHSNSSELNNSCGRPTYTARRHRRCPLTLSIHSAVRRLQDASYSTKLPISRIAEAWDNEPDII
jgi:hypothetical protein